MPSIYSRMFKKFKDKRYRDAFLASQVRRMIPKQVRAIRDAQGMTQQELADAAHTTQTVISRIEKGSGSGNLTIKSLLNLASALDVALVIRFEPIDRLIEFTENLSSNDIAPRRSEATLAEMEQEAARAEAEAVDSPLLRAARGSGQSPQENSGAHNPPQSTQQAQRQQPGWATEAKRNEGNLKLAG